MSKGGGKLFYDKVGIDDNWTGTSAADNMWGQGGSDVIHGMGGDDQIYGGTGNDTLYGDDSNDTIQGQEGNDLLYGGAGHDNLLGDVGADTLWGGTGGDYFSYNSVTDSVAGTGIDTIMDFNPAEGDRINIDVLETGETPYHLVSQATGTAQEVTLTYVNDGSYGGQGYTVLNLYLPDGNTAADMTIDIVGQHLTIDGIYPLQM